MSNANPTEWTVIGALSAIERDIFRMIVRRDQQVLALETMLADLNGLHLELAEVRQWWQDDREDLVAWMRGIRAIRKTVAPRGGYGGARPHGS